MLSVSLQFYAVIRFNKSSVRTNERRPPSQANVVTTLTLQSLNVCKYCNKQQGFPHKRCSSSTGTDRRYYGPWLQDRGCDRRIASFSLLCFYFYFLVGFPRRLQISDADKAMLCQVTVHTPNSPGFYSVSTSFPLIPAWESLSDGLISCSNATFIMAHSILCFRYAGSVVIPWPFWNMFAVNGRL